MLTTDHPAPLLSEAERAAQPDRMELQARAIEALRALDIDYHTAVRAINWGMRNRCERDMSLAP